MPIVDLLRLTRRLARNRSTFVCAAAAAATLNPAVATAEPTAAEAGFVEIHRVVPDAVVDLRYATTDNSARFPFGHGLSYTDFALSDLKLSDTALRWDGAVEITARLTNKGKRKGSEVVQLYIRDRVASRTRPIRELKRIQRVTLSPGDSTQA